MFSGCFSLQAIPLLNTATVTDMSGMFNSCFALQAIGIAPKVSFDISNALLSATALNALYTALPTVTGKTLTVTGNPGAATDNTSIATSKGWTIAG
jgi:hypothetical protein